MHNRRTAGYSIKKYNDKCVLVSVHSTLIYGNKNWKNLKVKYRSSILQDYHDLSVEKVCKDFLDEKFKFLDVRTLPYYHTFKINDYNVVAFTRVKPDLIFTKDDNIYVVEVKVNDWLVYKIDKCNSRYCNRILNQITLYWMAAKQNFLGKNIYVILSADLARKQIPEKILKEREANLKRKIESIAIRCLELEGILNKETTIKNLVRVITPRSL